MPVKRDILTQKGKQVCKKKKKRRNIKKKLTRAMIGTLVLVQVNIHFESIHHQTTINA
jgi:hypothetical protein